MHIHKWIDIDIIENDHSPISMISTLLCIDRMIMDGSFTYMFTKVFSTSHDSHALDSAPRLDKDPAIAPRQARCGFTLIANSAMALNYQ